MKIPSYWIRICLLLISSECLSASLSYTELPDGSFDLKLENDVVLEITQAQSAMYQTAFQLCKGKKPIYGKYKFESTEPVTSKGDGIKYYFLQKITCANKNEAKIRADKPVIDRQQEKQIEINARMLTDKYFMAKEAGNFRAAYEMLTPEMQQISSYSSWKDRESSYFKQLGGFISRDIRKITIYNNPDNSPKPGIYVAADYESKYDNSPINCGFVIWYLPEVNSKDYQVMREEYGSISKENLDKMNREEINTVRSKIGCKSF